MRDLAVGQRVICKHKNGRYYHSEVQELSPTTFYEVVFDDGSYSDNLFPEDIEVDEILTPTVYQLQLINLTGGCFFFKSFRTEIASGSDRLPRATLFKFDGQTG